MECLFDDLLISFVSDWYIVYIKFFGRCYVTIILLHCKMLAVA